MPGFVRRCTRSCHEGFRNENKHQGYEEPAPDLWSLAGGEYGAGPTGTVTDKCGGSREEIPQFVGADRGQQGFLPWSVHGHDLKRRVSCQVSVESGPRCRGEGLCGVHRM